MTERHDDMPPDEGLRANESADAAEREARLEAMLSLSSEPSPSLDALITSRRDAGDRVILPVPDVSRETERRWRRYAIPATLIAAAAVLFALLQLQSASRDREREEQMMTRRDSQPGGVPVVVPDTATRDSVTPPSALELELPDRRDVSLGIGAPLAGERAVYSARLTTLRTSAVDSVLSFLSATARARATISYPAGDTGLAAVATEVREALEERGVARRRISAQVTPPDQLAPVAVIVTVIAPR